MGDLKKRRELVRMALKVTDNECIEEWQILVQSWEVRNPQRTLLEMVCTSGSGDNELEGGGQ